MTINYLKIVKYFYFDEVGGVGDVDDGVELLTTRHIVNVEDKNKI